MPLSGARNTQPLSLDGLYRIRCSIVGKNDGSVKSMLAKTDCLDNKIPYPMMRTSLVGHLHTYASVLAQTR